MSRGARSLCGRARRREPVTLEQLTFRCLHGPVTATNVLGRVLCRPGPTARAQQSSCHVSRGRAELRTSARAEKSSRRAAPGPPRGTAVPTPRARRHRSPRTRARRSRDWTVPVLPPPPPRSRAWSRGAGRPHSEPRGSAPVPPAPPGRTSPSARPTPDVARRAARRCRLLAPPPAGPARPRPAVVTAGSATMATTRSTRRRPSVDHLGLVCRRGDAAPRARRHAHPTARRPLVRLRTVPCAEGVAGRERLG